MSKALELTREVMATLLETTGVSGYEHSLVPSLQEIFSKLDSEVSHDFIGNFYAYKHCPHSKYSILLAAHFDEIGLILTHIDDRGFLHFTTVGGIDPRTLVHQEVTVHGRETVKGVVVALPLEEDGKEQKQKAVDIQHLVIDIGYPYEMAQTHVKPGDIVSLRRTPQNLLNTRIAGKALDDRAGIAVLAVCMQELCRLKSTHAVYAVATVQEEVGLRGATTCAEHIGPTLAIAVDVTHAQSLDTKSQTAIGLDKGPVITIGPNIHPRIAEALIKVAKESRFPHQVQAVAGATGTDARVIQLTGQGIPTGLISIPLRYMHTTVETASLNDIVDCGKLLACFIASLPEDLEEWLCF